MHVRVVQDVRATSSNCLSSALAIHLALAREILVIDVRNHPEIDVSPASHIICILVNVVM